MDTAYAAGSVDTVMLDAELCCRFSPSVGMCIKLPFTRISGETTVGASTENVTVNGLGDIRVNVSFKVFDGTKTEPAVINPWVIKLGAGCVLPTGASDVEEGATVLPIDFQPGGGVLRPLVSASFIQKRASWSPFLAFAGEIGLGPNDQDNERASKLGINGGGSWPLGAEGRTALICAAVLDKSLAPDEEGGTAIEDSDKLNTGILAGVNLAGDTMSLGLMANYYFQSSTDGTAWNILLAITWNF